MENLLLKAIMVSIFMWITFFDKYVTQFFTYRPIVVGPIVGAIMGDINIGLQVGCTIELMFLGQVFVGTALPPEETFSTGIAAAFACISGNQQLALATALPLAILGQMVCISVTWHCVYGHSIAWKLLLSVEVKLVSS